jgi:hypothetical protein
MPKLEYPSHQFMCLYVYPNVVATQRLGKNITTTKNRHVTIEALVDTSFSIWSVSYKRKVGNHMAMGPSGARCQE